jgi:3-deoxy-manno-octulosonate cytidylyltransferase (CMP-KDO synthetase)
MIVRVLERVRQAKGISLVMVATDDTRIAQAVRSASGHAVMTRADHSSGTERLAEVAAFHTEAVADYYLNVQGDEPLVEPAALEALIESVRAPAPGGSPASHAPVATLATPITEAEDLADPHVVKVVTDVSGYALYFSRSGIPNVRDAAPSSSASDTAARAPAETPHLQHLGVYLYSRETLLAFPKLPRGRLEQLEQLEQLRLLENGYRIRVVVTPHDSISVDVPADVSRVEALLKQ